jgi:CRP/FNR family transcriptional regulator, cyclic AMP receptor protein
MLEANRIDHREDKENQTGPTLYALLRQGKVARVSCLHPRGRVLFAEGDPPKGVFILRAGIVSISASSRDGRIVILRTARPGDIVGLNSVLRNCGHDTTVKTISACHTEFILRSELLQLLERDLTAAQIIARALSQELTELTHRAKTLLLAESVNARLARLLLEWARPNDSDPLQPMICDRLFTHEEIAQMLCSSRETVTRLLATLNRRRIVRSTADSILICDLLALQEIASKSS